MDNMIMPPFNLCYSLNWIVALCQPKMLYFWRFPLVSHIPLIYIFSRETSCFRIELRLPDYEACALSNELASRNVYINIEWISYLTPLQQCQFMSGYIYWFNISMLHVYKWIAKIVSVFPHNPGWLITISINQMTDISTYVYNIMLCVSKMLYTSVMLFWCQLGRRCREIINLK